MPERVKKMVDDYQTQSLLSSINSKLLVIVAIIVFGIGSNLFRSYLDFMGDKRQARINFLDKRNEELVQRLRSVRDRADACESSVPMPTINKVN